MYTTTYTGIDGDIMFWATEVLLGVSGTRGFGRAGLKRYRISEYHCGPVAFVHGVCLPNWKWNVPTGQRSVSQGSSCVGVVPGT